MTEERFYRILHTLNISQTSQGVQAARAHILQGATKAEAARYYNISAAAVGQMVKRIKNTEPALTVPERLLLEGADDEAVDYLKKILDKS